MTAKYTGLVSTEKDMLTKYRLPVKTVHCIVHLAGSQQKFAHHYIKFAEHLIRFKVRHLDLWDLELNKESNPLKRRMLGITNLMRRPSEFVMNKI